MVEEGEKKATKINRIASDRPVFASAYLEARICVFAYLRICVFAYLRSSLRILAAD
jgi:hypothetical protein